MADNCCDGDMFFIPPDLCFLLENIDDEIVEGFVVLMGNLWVQELDCNDWTLTEKKEKLVQFLNFLIEGVQGA